MPNKIIYTAVATNTTKPIEYYHVVTNQYQDSETLLNVPAGVYAGFKARLKGSNPEIIAYYPGNVTVVNGSTTPVPTTYTSTKSFTATCGSGTTGNPVTKTSTKTGSTQLLADQAALANATAQANAALVCTPITSAPILTTILTGPSDDEATGTQLTSSDGALFKFMTKPLGDGTGKLMYLSINGEIVGSVDFLAPYLTRIDGGVGGELFSFQLTDSSTVYYGRFKDFEFGPVALTTAYNI